MTIKPSFRRAASSAMARQARYVKVGKKPRYVTAERAYTMRELAQEIERGTPIGTHHLEDMMKAAELELAAKKAVLKPGETKEEAIERVVLERLRTY